jgi:hypothetical protein
VVHGLAWNGECKFTVDCFPWQRKYRSDAQVRSVLSQIWTVAKMIASRRAPALRNSLANQEWVWSTPENYATLVRNRARLV